MSDYFFYKIRSPFSYFFHSISLTPAFPGLWNFHQGCGFKQWTGDNSKALMKVSICYQYIQQCLLINWQVYLPVIEGYVPSKMIKALHTFLEFAYIARRNIHDTRSLEQMDDALQHYHHHRKIFLTTGVRTSFNLPRQHALIHYTKSICLFGSQNGLCSSITESKHIKAVKEPWQRSGHFEALCQMLLTNQHADKLTATRADFKKQGMLKGTCLSSVLVNLSTLHCFHWLSDVWPKGSI